MSETEVRDIFYSSSPTLSNTHVIAEEMCVLAPVITRMTNSSLVSGCVPDNWKIAPIIPLIKKLGLEIAHGNFRPVSNIPFISKIAEKAVIPQVLDREVG